MNLIIEPVECLLGGFLANQLFVVKCEIFQIKLQCLLLGLFRVADGITLVKDGEV